MEPGVAAVLGDAAALTAGEAPRLGDAALPTALLPPAGGAPLRSRWKALIFAAISGFSPPPLPIVLCGGRRAALRLPRGVDEFVMLVPALDSRGGDASSCDEDSRPGDEGGEGDCVGESSAAGSSLGESMMWMRYDRLGGKESAAVYDCREVWKKLMSKDARSGRLQRGPELCGRRCKLIDSDGADLGEDLMSLVKVIDSRNT